MLMFILSTVKNQSPAIYSSEIQNKLVEDNVCLPENAKHDLGYSYKKIEGIASKAL